MKTLIVIVALVALFATSYIHFAWLIDLSNDRTSQNRTIHEILSKLDEQHRFNQKIADTFRKGCVSGWKIEKKQKNKHKIQGVKYGKML